MKASPNPPLVLAFDCACQALSVAVARGDRLLAEHYESRSEKQAALLAPIVQSVLRAAEVKPAQLDLIGVTTGPGSFTGIRIGLAFARGLALALDRPLAGRTTFDAVGDGLANELRDPNRRLIAAIDSKREEMFIRVDGQAPLMLTPDQAAAGLPGGRYGLVGDGAPELMLAVTRLGRQQECVVLSSAPPRASAFAPVLASQGVEAWRERNAREGLPQPYYLRAPDVTMGRHKQAP